MPDPTQIWGTYGESSGGGGTGGPTPSTPDPSGTYAQCNDIEPDAPPDPDNRVLWNNVKSCGGATLSVEWALNDDPTYPLNSVYRVTDLTGGDLLGEQCVLVTDDRALSGPTGPDLVFPLSTIICGGYPDCDECNATCYKITDCLTAAVTYSNSVALAGVTGFRSVIGGRCYTVAVEADKSNCCPDTDTDVSPAGSYADCAACDLAINPDCGDAPNSLPAGDPPAGYASSYTITLSGYADCDPSGPITVEWNGFLGQWYGDNVYQAWLRLGGSTPRVWELVYVCNVPGGDNDATYERACESITGGYDKVSEGHGTFGGTATVL